MKNALSAMYRGKVLIEVCYEQEKQRLFTRVTNQERGLKPAQVKHMQKLVNTEQCNRSLGPEDPLYLAISA